MRLFSLPVINYHIETARHRDDQLLKLLVGMAASLCSAGYVVKVVNAFDGEGDMLRPLDKCQVSHADRKFFGRSRILH